MTEYEKRARLWVVLLQDAMTRAGFMAIQKISAYRSMEERFTGSIPKIAELDDGFVFDPLADHALLYYTVAGSDSVQCVGRFISSGLGMQAEGFGT